MITILWLMTAAVWGGHIGLLFVGQSVLHQLLFGHAPAWVIIALLAAMLPQLYLIPWAWRHVDRPGIPRIRRRLWRLSFFFTGFLATTVYLVMYRSAGHADHT